MISHDFASRLTSLAQLRKQTYVRGFWWGVLAGVVGVLFVAWWISVGAAS